MFDFGHLVDRFGGLDSLHEYVVQCALTTSSAPPLHGYCCLSQSWLSWMINPLVLLNEANERVPDHRDLYFFDDKDVELKIVTSFFLLLIGWQLMVFNLPEDYSHQNIRSSTRRRLNSSKLKGKLVFHRVCFAVLPSMGPYLLHLLPEMVPEKQKNLAKRHRAWLVYGVWSMPVRTAYNISDTNVWKTDGKLISFRKTIRSYLIFSSCFGSKLRDSGTYIRKTI
ncbi:hypothetical protein Bca4012_021251 [Brassica carinata]